MEDLNSIDTSILLDMLSTKTEQYTRSLHGENKADNFTALKSTIDDIQSELNARHDAERKTA